jgi:hypothetical protein
MNKYNNIRSNMPADIDRRLEKNVSIVAGMIVPAFILFGATFFVDKTEYPTMTLVFIVTALLLIGIGAIAACYRIYLMSLMTLKDITTNRSRNIKNDDIAECINSELKEPISKSGADKIEQNRK